MPKERNRDTFRVAKVTRVHPDSQDPKLHQRYEHVRILLLFFFNRNKHKFIL
jgi:hypothetical protein